MAHGTSVGQISASVFLRASQPPKQYESALLWKVNQSQNQRAKELLEFYLLQEKPTWSTFKKVWVFNFRQDRFP